MRYSMYLLIYSIDQLFPRSTILDIEKWGQGSMQLDRKVLM